MPLMPTTIFQDQAGALALIEDISLSGTATIEFLNIPQNYAHLEIVASLRGVGAVNEEALRLRFNNDGATTSHGSFGSVLNAAFSGSNDSAGAYVMCGNVPGASASADRYCAVRFTIPHYGGGEFKSVFSVFGYSYAGTAATTRAGSGGGTWPIADPITRVLIFTGTGGGQFAAGSRATLYGVV